MDFRRIFNKVIKGAQEKKPYRLGIALGGGGAKGFAHLGVLQALKENNLMPDMIAGTSAGAMIGAFVASGMEPKEAHNLLKEKNLFGYSKIQWPKEGLFSLDGLGKVIADKITVKKIEDLKIPLVVTVSNLNKGRVEYLKTGNLADSVLASGSIPFVFKPVEIDGFKLADGGILDNLPIMPLIDHCQKIIAVRISPTDETDDLDDLIKIGARTFQLSVNVQNNNFDKNCDLFIEPEGIGAFDLFDTDKADELFELGYDSICEKDFNKLR